MNSLADALHQVEDALRETVGMAFRSGELRRLDDDSVLSLMAQAASTVRQAQAVLVATVAEVQDRDETSLQAASPTTRYGCRSMRELVQRTTHASGRTVADVLRAARAIKEHVSTTGEVLSAKYPAMREAAADGAIGLDALVAVVAALDTTTCGHAALSAADTELAASARGSGEGGGPNPSADDLKLQAQVWAMYLDQDGAEPRETRALRKRGFTMGVCSDGLVPFRGNALPEVASQFR